MEKVAESGSSSSLAWRWTIETLASSALVKPSLLHDVIDQAKELPEDTRNNAGEMVALKCLEGLFGSLNYNAENGLPAQESNVTFDSSESCEDVVKRVCMETPNSTLRVAGPDMSKWDVSSFIAQKRSTMRCMLHQLKDSILDGTHSYADFLMQKSGLMPVDKRDSNVQNKNDLNKHCRRLDSNSSDPQARKEHSKGSSLNFEDERRPSSSSLLPSKRSFVDLTSEDEARDLPGCDDGFANAVKKLKRHSAHTSNTGMEEASSRGIELLEDSPERVVSQNERDGSDHFDKHPVTTVEDRVVEAEHFVLKTSGQNTTTNDELHPVEISTRFTIPDPIEDDEMHEVISVEKAKDGNEVTIEPKASNNYHAEGNVPNIITGDPELNFGDDNDHVNETNTLSHSKSQPKTAGTDIDVGMNPDEEENDMSSDIDRCLYGRIDVAVKKKEFLSSQCTVNHDSFLSADGRESTVCVKCNQGGQLLSCNYSDCPLVVHDKCLSSSARTDDEGDFICPFCSYSLAISEYLEAKKNAALAKKNVATFIRTGLGHQSIVIKEVLQQKDLVPSRKAGDGDAAKVCEYMDLENKNNQRTLDVEHVKEVVGHQFPTVIDIERILEQSRPVRLGNSNHRQNEASTLRVAPDVLSGEKDGDELVNQELRGGAGELKDGQKATEQLGICDTLLEEQWPVEVADTPEGLQYQTDDNEEESAYAINIEGQKSYNDNDDDESIISRYSLRFRRKYHQLVSSYFHSTTSSGGALGGATGQLRSASPRSDPASGSAPLPLPKKI